MELDNYYSFLRTCISKETKEQMVYKESISIENIDFFNDLINAEIITILDNAFLKNIKLFLTEIEIQKWEEIFSNESFMQFLFSIIQQLSFRDFPISFFTALVAHAKKTLKGEISYQPTYKNWGTFQTIFKTNNPYCRIITNDLLNTPSPVPESFFTIYGWVPLSPTSTSDVNNLIIKVYLPIINEKSIIKLEWIRSQFINNRYLIKKISDKDLFAAFKSNLDITKADQKVSEITKSILTLINKQSKITTEKKDIE